MLLRNWLMSKAQSRGWTIVLLFCGVLGAQEQEKEDDLAGRSLDELLNIKINTAAKYEQTSREAPAAVTIITAEDIKTYGYETLEDVFKSVRGFYTSNDRNYSYVGVRGFSRPTDFNNRILLLLNGHTANEDYHGLALIGTEAEQPLDLRGGISRAFARQLR